MAGKYSTSYTLMFSKISWSVRCSKNVIDCTCQSHISTYLKKKKKKKMKIWKFLLFRIEKTYFYYFNLSVSVSLQYIYSLEMISFRHASISVIFPLALFLSFHRKRIYLIFHTKSDLTWSHFIAAMRRHAQIKTCVWGYHKTCLILSMLSFWGASDTER